MKGNNKRKALFLGLALALVIALVLSACAKTETVTSTETRTVTPAPGAAATITVTQTVTSTVTKTVTAAPPTVTAPTITLTVAEGIPPAGFFYEVKSWWIGQVKERTGGRVEIKPYWGASLAGWPDMLGALQTGITDIGHLAPSYFQSQMPLSSIMLNVGNTTNHWAGIRASYEVYEKDPYLKVEAERVGVMPIMGYSSGWVHLGFRKPVRTLADMKGLLVHNAGGGQPHLYRQLGIEPIFMNYADVYEAMSRGTIDGHTVLWPLSEAMKLYEVDNTVYEHLLMHAGLSPMNFISLKVWNSLPTDIQDILLDLNNDYMDYYAQKLLAFEDVLRAKWIERGVTLVQPSPDDQQKLSEALPKAQDAFLAELEGMPGGERARDVWATFQNLEKQYAAEVVEKGYPWER